MNPQTVANPIALDSCRQAEEKILSVRNLMLNPRLENLDQCVAELDHIGNLLSGLVKAGAKDWTPAVVGSFSRIKSAAEALGFQIEHALRFCRGWIQLGWGTGYTDQGLPVLISQETGRGFEG